MAGLIAGEPAASRLGQVDLSVLYPGPAGDLAYSAASATGAARLSTVTVTPGPMVELTDTFLR